MKSGALWGDKHKDTGFIFVVLTKLDCKFILKQRESWFNRKSALYSEGEII